MWARLRARRGRRRDRRSQRALRADPRARARHRRRGARLVVQAGGGRSLPRARHGDPARALRRRRVRARQRDAVARDGAARALAARPRSSCSPIARARRRCRSVEIVDLRAHRPGPHRRQAHQPARSIARSRRRSPPRSRRSSSSIAAASRRASAARGAASSRRARTAPSRSPSTRRRAGTMRCHWCDYEAPLPAALQEVRLGSHRARGPRHREARGDADRRVPDGARSRGSIATSRRGKQIEKVLDRVRSREVDILVGTQMVTKGHDLPARHARRRHQRRRRALDPRLSRERARVPAPRPGRRARGPRRHAGPRARADVRSGAPRHQVRARSTT